MASSDLIYVARKRLFQNRNIPPRTEEGDPSFLLESINTQGFVCPIMAKRVTDQTFFLIDGRRRLQTVQAICSAQKSRASEFRYLPVKLVSTVTPEDDLRLFLALNYENLGAADRATVVSALLSWGAVADTLPNFARSAGESLQSTQRHASNPRAGLLHISRCMPVAPLTDGRNDESNSAEPLPPSIELLLAKVELEAAPNMPFLRELVHQFDLLREFAAGKIGRQGLIDRLRSPARAPTLSSVRATQKS